MFVKIGEPSPITIVEQIDQINDETTRTSLKKAIKAIKEKQKVIPAQINKESEKK